MGALHFNSYAYSPPTSLPLFLPGTKKYESLSYLHQTVGDDEEYEFKVRVFHFHGNAQNIVTTDYMRTNLLGAINSNLSLDYQNRVKVECVAIDYPGYGLSDAHWHLLGTPELGSQVLRLYLDLKLNKGEGLNILWSYSIGTHYSSRLLRDADVDFAYMQAPFISISTDGGSFLAKGYDGYKSQGLEFLKCNELGHNFLLHVGGADDVFPPYKNYDLMKQRFGRERIILDKGKSHEWFADTLDAAEFGAMIIGKEITRLLDIRKNQLSSSSNMENPSSSEEEEKEYSSSSPLSSKAALFMVDPSPPKL